MRWSEISVKLYSLKLAIFPYLFMHLFGTKLLFVFLTFIYSFKALASEVLEDNTVFGVDMSIDGLRSYEFSVYIFVFLILSLIVFGVIIWLYLPKKLSQLKTGEKIMFGSLVFGMVAAVVIGYIQLIEGYLL